MSFRYAALCLLIGCTVLADAARCDDLAAVVAAYEALARQTDADSGPGWPDVSKAAADRRTVDAQALRTRLASLPAASANPEDALTRRLLDWRLAILVEGARFDEDRIPFDSGDGFFNTANYAAATTVIRDEAAAQAWIERLRALPAYYDQQMANLRRGMSTGFMPPRPTVEGVLAILRIAEEQRADSSPLLAPLRHLPAAIAAQRQAALRAQALAVVEQVVKPAQTRLRRFFDNDYLPHARRDLGAATLPGGADYYRFAVRRSTTTDLTPEQIFSLGESEVARIRDQMQGAMRDAGFGGTLGEFIAALRTDPRFYAPDLQTYIEKASEIGKRVDAMLPLWFGKLPRLTWGIQVKPPELDASSGGYNLGDPEKGVAGFVVLKAKAFGDPLFSLPAWILHEGVPGHHLQIALGQERTDLPRFRRRDDVTAFVEGWALYSERLGEEMGVYRTPYEHFGRLSFEMWRACRLMMAVGIHMKGWTAERAASCLRDNTTLPDRVIQEETQRYISWPAQALAYKIGEIRISQLRQEAEAAKGSRFDIRAFHDELLDEGPMPLAVLEERMHAWMHDALP